jgi:hypothetical protein
VHRLQFQSAQGAVSKQVYILVHFLFYFFNTTYWYWFMGPLGLWYLPYFYFFDTNERKLSLQGRIQPTPSRGGQGKRETKKVSLP